MELVEYLKFIISPYYKEIGYFSYMILASGVFQNFIYFMQVPLAAAELFRASKRRRDDHLFSLVKSSVSLPISVIIPSYNEENTIYETASAALNTRYPTFEVVVVNDGSKDKTLEVLKEGFELKENSLFLENHLDHKDIRAIYKSSIHSNLIVVDKENGGRSDALNAGLGIIRNPIFCTLDADSFLDPTALLETTAPFLFNPDIMMATGGTVRVSNGATTSDGHVEETKLSSKSLVRFQVMEYIRAFLLGRLAWSRLGMVTVLSGAFAIFKTDVAIKVGGFTLNTIGEDFDLVMKIHEYYLKHGIKYKMRFIPEPVCWTEVPESLSVLRNQRIRWQQGGLEVLSKNIRMLFNPRYGRIGLFAYPLMFLIDVVTPLLETIGYILLPIFYLLDALNTEFMIGFFCLFFGIGIFISVMSLILEEMFLRRAGSVKELLILGFYAVIENFGYRQLNNLWRIIGWFRFMKGKQVWGDMKRKGTGKDKKSSKSKKNKKTKDLQKS